MASFPARVVFTRVRFFFLLLRACFDLFVALRLFALFLGFFFFVFGFLRLRLLPFPGSCVRCAGATSTWRPA
jgi:hypothetical protein